jgi:putative ABC transport system substrate-binding protein
MRRRAFNALFAIAFTTPRLVLAQERAKLARIGYLGLAPAAGYAPRVDALRAGLHDLGYIEGRNLSFEFRWAEDPQQMPKLAAELVSAGVDVIFTPSSMETGAALETTKTLPVIFGAHADPVGVGHVGSLSRPGGNATGMTMLLTDLVAKELEALKEALPNARRFGVLFASSAPSHVPALQAAERAARRLDVELRHAPVRNDEELRDAIPQLARDGVDGFMVFATPLTFLARGPIAELAIRHRLPSVFGTKDNVVAGGLMSYAPDAAALTRRAAVFVDRVLKGEKPADLPVEQATRYELTINLKTAQALGLTIPPTLLARADEVIE